MLVPMHLSRILIRETTSSQIIELAESSGKRTFPIVIGTPEAAAIERRLKGEPILRPQTHDLLAAVIEVMGGRIDRVVISDLVDGTFFAKIVIARDGGELEIDSRPSDAIALVAAIDCPILVAEHVLDQTQTIPPPTDEDEKDDEGPLDWD